MAAARARSARSRGLRTLQHQTLPVQTTYGIDTEVWFRNLVAEHGGRRGQDGRAPSKDDVHDEALILFLDRHARTPLEQYPARRATDQDVTFWIDSKLIERARDMALRDGVKPARLIDAALSSYVRLCVPEQLFEFRRQTQEQACKLYQAVDQRTRRRVPRAR